MKKVKIKKSSVPQNLLKSQISVNQLKSIKGGGDDIIIITEDIVDF